MAYPTELNYITCAFGVKGDWAAGVHTGTDFRASVGTPVFATTKGKVVHAGYGGYGSAYGNHIIIQQGKRRVLYAHLSRTDVRPGNKVKAGQRIGLSGDTGNVFGAHLHYEERVRPYGYYNYARPIHLKASKPKWPKKWGKRVNRARINRTMHHLGKYEGKTVTWMLNAVVAHLRKAGYTVDGWPKSQASVKRAIQKFQKNQGWKGSDADGTIGKETAKRLGLKSYYVPVWKPKKKG